MTLYSLAPSVNDLLRRMVELEILAPEDVTDFQVRSLHDPSVVYIPSVGSYRMYVTAFVDNDPPGPGGDDYEIIISADTGPPSVP